MLGAAVCVAHGGAAPQVREAGKRRIADQKALDAIESLLHNADADPVTDPLMELSRLAGVLRDAVDAVGGRVNALSTVASHDLRGSESLRAEVALWEKLLGLSGNVLGQMSKLDTTYRLARQSAMDAERQSESQRAALWVGWVLERLALAGLPEWDGLRTQMLHGLGTEGALPPTPVFAAPAALEAGVDDGEDDDAD